MGSGAAKQAYALLRAEREAERRRSRRRRNLLAILAVAGAYLVIYLLGRIFGAAPGSYSLAGWLFGNDPQQLSYLYGWLLRQKLFWAALLISALPALWGKYRFSATASIGFALGLAPGDTATTDGPSGAGASCSPWLWAGCWSGCPGGGWLSNPGPSCSGAPCLCWAWPLWYCWSNSEPRFPPGAETRRTRCALLGAPRHSISSLALPRRP